MQALTLSLLPSPAFAAAPVPAFEPTARILGTYQVTEINVKAGREDSGTFCRSPERPTERADAGSPPPPRPHPECGKTVWVVRSDTQIALLESGIRAGQLHAFGLSSEKKCRTAIPEDNAGLFCSELCKATVLSSYGAEDPLETFEFSDEPGELQDIGAGMIATSDRVSFEIHLPRGVTVPEEIRFEKRVSTTALIFSIPIPVSSRWSYTLKRIGD